MVPRGSPYLPTPLRAKKKSQNADAARRTSWCATPSRPRRDRPPYGTPVFLGFVCELAAEAEGYRKGREELMKEYDHGAAIRKDATAGCRYRAVAHPPQREIRPLSPRRENCSPSRAGRISHLPPRRRPRRQPRAQCGRRGAGNMTLSPSRRPRMPRKPAPVFHPFADLNRRTASDLVRPTTRGRGAGGVLRGALSCASALGLVTRDLLACGVNQSAAASRKS